MTRGLPLSMIIHALTLGLVLMFGNMVQQKTYETPKTIGVRLVELPRTQPKEEKPVEDIKILEPPKPQPKQPDELPPKELPEPKKEIKKEPPKEEAREEKPKEIEPDEVSEPAAAIPPTTGAAIAGTDANFPFAWYLAIMEGQVARNWNPRQMGFRNDAGIACVVHFTIQRSGLVVQMTLVRSSGVGVYDREALRAVQSTRLPQLPGDFGANSLGVTMTFNLESGDR